MQRKVEIQEKKYALGCVKSYKAKLLPGHVGKVPQPELCNVKC